MDDESERRYAIRYDIDQPWWKVPISLSSNPKKANRLSLVMVLIILATAIIAGIMFTKTPAIHAQLWANVMWLVGYAMLFYLLMMPSGPHEYGYQYIKPMLLYFGTKHRVLNTRKEASASNVADFYGYGNATIKVNGKREKIAITKNGLLVKNDGTMIRLVEIEGNSSNYLQVDVINSILRSTTNVYRSFPKNAEVHFITKQTNQRVVIQLQHEQERIDGLKAQQAQMINPQDIQPLIDIEEEKKRVLKQYVGTEFKTLRQYALVQADSRDEINTAIDIMFANTSSNGNAAFRYIRPIETREEATIWLHNQNCSLSQLQDYDG